MIAEAAEGPLDPSHPAPLGSRLRGNDDERHSRTSDGRGFLASDDFLQVAVDS